MRYKEIDAYIDYLLHESTPEKTVWNIESARQGKGSSWNYIDGCMLTALQSLGEITGDPQYSDFVAKMADAFIDQNGEIRGYRPKEYNLDNINEGRILFELFARTGKAAYRLAADRLKAQLDAQPRTAEGNFWHKSIYPNQVWLDGIYMAQVFSALYAKNFGNGDYSDVLSQIGNVRRLMYNEEKRLYFHGYDESRSAFWADKTTGCSKSFWLRSIGWFAVALADLTSILPDAKQGQLPVILRELVEGILPYADEESGMFYQVVDQGARHGNYLETSGTCMLAYAFLKAARLGVLPAKYAAKGLQAFEGTMRKYLSMQDGRLNLGGICLSAGLGPANNPKRDGSFSYYISEPVVSNDAKGVAPFILCYTEVLRLG